VHGAGCGSTRLASRPCWGALERCVRVCCCASDVRRRQRHLAGSLAMLQHAAAFGIMTKWCSHCWQEQCLWQQLLVWHSSLSSSPCLVICKVVTCAGIAQRNWHRHKQAQYAPAINHPFEVLFLAAQIHAPLPPPPRPQECYGSFQGQPDCSTAGQRRPYSTAQQMAPAAAARASGAAAALIP